MTSSPRAATQRLEHMERLMTRLLLVGFGDELGDDAPRLERPGGLQNWLDHQFNAMREDEAEMGARRKGIAVGGV